MSDPRSAPYAAVRLVDVARLADVDPGNEELFAVMSGCAVFTIAGEEIEAPAGTLVFVRDPKLLRFACAPADGTAILAVGARPGAPFAVSRWEQAVRAS